MKDDYIAEQISETLDNIKISLQKIEDSYQHIDALKWDIKLLNDLFKEYKKDGKSS